MGVEKGLMEECGRGRRNNFGFRKGDVGVERGLMEESGSGRWNNFGWREDVWVAK